eukprot:1138685-Pelagomonas_calceolata.AAC.1
MLNCHSWSLQIINLWNTAAKIRLNEKNPTCLTKLARDIPEARWWKVTISIDPVLNSRHPDIETGFKKFGKLPSDHWQHIVTSRRAIEGKILLTARFWSRVLPVTLQIPIRIPGEFPLEKRKRKNYVLRLVGSENTPCINKGKGDILAQRAASLPHRRVRGKLVWVRVSMELSCKLGRPCGTRSDQDSIRAAGGASRLIRNAGVKEVMLIQTVCAAYIHVYK